MHTDFEWHLDDKSIVCHTCYSFHHIILKGMEEESTDAEIVHLLEEITNEMDKLTTGLDSIVENLLLSSSISEAVLCISVCTVLCTQEHCGDTHRVWHNYTCQVTLKDQLNPSNEALYRHYRRSSWVIDYWRKAFNSYYLSLALGGS